MKDPEKKEREEPASTASDIFRDTSASEEAYRWSEFANSRPHVNLLRRFYEEAKREAEERRGQADR